MIYIIVQMSESEILNDVVSFFADTATTVSDSEAKNHGRRPRRRTTGGSEVGEEVEKAKRLQGQGNSSEPDAQSTQTLSRQQIIAMVKKRFGLKPGEEDGNKPNGIQHEPPVNCFSFVLFLQKGDDKNIGVRW